MQPFIETVVNRRMHRQAGRGCSTVNFGLGAQPPYRCNNTAAAAQLQQHHQLKLSAGPSWLGLSLAWAAAAWVGHPVIEVRGLRATDQKVQNIADDFGIIMVILPCQLC